MTTPWRSIAALLGLTCLLTVSTVHARPDALFGESIEVGCHHYGVAWTQDSARLVTATGDCVEVIDRKTRKVTRFAPRAQTRGFYVGLDHLLLYVDDKLRAYDLVKGELAWERDHVVDYDREAFLPTPDGLYMSRNTGKKDARFELVRIRERDGHILRTYGPYSELYRGIDVHRGKLVMAADPLTVLSPGTGKVIQRIKMEPDADHPSCPEVIAFSDDGRRLLLGDLAGLRIAAWDVARRRKLWNRPFDTDADGGGWARWLDGGRTVLLVDGSTNLGHFLNGRTGKSRREPLEDVLEAYWDGRRVVVLRPHEIRFYDRSMKKLLRKVESDSPFSIASLSPDGKHLLIKDAGDPADVWILPPKDLWKLTRPAKKKTKK